MKNTSLFLKYIIYIVKKKKHYRGQVFYIIGRSHFKKGKFQMKCVQIEPSVSLGMYEASTSEMHQAWFWVSLCAMQ